MATLDEILANPSLRAKLPAGMRNNNPGNIKYVGQQGAGIVGPSVNTDQGDPQVVFASPEAGMAAMYRLLAKKYQGGKTTANAIIAGNGGWTPGNYQAAANAARYGGFAPDADIHLTDPASATRFMRGLMMQEHGNSSRLYPDAMIQRAVQGGGIFDGAATPSARPPLPNGAGTLPQPSGAPGSSIASLYAQPADADGVQQMAPPAAPALGLAALFMQQQNARQLREQQRQDEEQARRQALFGGSSGIASLYG